MKISKLSYIFALICITACTSGQKRPQIANYASLEEADACLIPIDSITTQETSYIQLIDDSILAYFNKPSYEICLTNLKSKETEKIGLFRDGPNAVPGVDGFYYVSPDSIWLYAAWGKVLMMVNSEGTLLQKKQIPETDKNGEMLPYSVSPYVMTVTPYIVKGDEHILQGMCGPSNDKQTPGVTLIYNVSTDSVSTGNPYPAIYGDKDQLMEWDTFGYRQTYYTLTPSGDILTTFPASDSLYLYNPGTQERNAYYAGYSMPTEISNLKSSGLADKFENYLSQYQYGCILYDRWNNVYYRLVRLPLHEYDKDKLREAVTKKPNVVIILDENLNIIGETALPEDSYYPVNSFVNSEGLHIHVISDDDDFMKFKVFKLNS